MDQRARVLVIADEAAVKRRCRCVLRSLGCETAALIAALCLTACPRPVPNADGGGQARDGGGDDAGREVSIEELAEGEVLVGLLTSRSGPLAGIDRGMIEAAWLARSQINAAGGVLGMRLGIVVEDDGSSDDVAPAAFTRLDARPEVVATVGPTTYNAREAILGPPSPTEPARPSPPMALLCPANCVPADVGARPAAFAVASNMPIGSRMLAEHLSGSAAGKTAAVLNIQLEGDGLYNAAQSAGLEILARESYPDPSPEFVDYATWDFGPTLDRVLAEPPDVLFLGSFWTDGARITAALKERLPAERRPQLVGWRFHRFDEFLAAADPEVVEGMVGYAPLPPADDPHYAAFVSAYQQAFDAAPPLLADKVYDAVYLIALAVERAGRAEREALFEALPAVSRPPGDKIDVGAWEAGRTALAAGREVDYDGASGPVDWGDDGFLTNESYVIWTVHGGRFEHLVEVSAY